MNTFEVYNKIYGDLNFERRGLFRLLHQMYPNMKVVYPGCSVHIASSFYFQHVLYIDRSQTAIDFFSDVEAVRRLIAHNKVYKETAFFSFSASDFKEIRDATEHKYDLLISLYADEVIENCMSFLRHGGIAVSNNFHDEVIKVLKSGKMEFIGSISGKRSNYSYSINAGVNVAHRDEEAVQKKCMKNYSGGVQYIDNEKYYVLRKI